MKKFLLIALVLVLTACYHSGVNASVQSVDGMTKVEYLFTVEGVNVYRFWDGSNAHYLAIGQGTVVNSQIGSKSKYDDSVIRATR